MTVPSSNPCSVVSIRHVAIGFMGYSNIILVVVKGVAHLVSCKINPESAGPDIDHRFGLLNTTMLGDDGMRRLAEHITELRTHDSVTEPIRWCCYENTMRDFSSLVRADVSAQDLQIGRLADLPAPVKASVVQFSHDLLRPMRYGAVKVRLKRLKLSIGA